MLAFITLTDEITKKPVEYAAHHILTMTPSEKGSHVQMTNGKVYGVCESLDVIRDKINQAIYSTALTMRAE